MGLSSDPQEFPFSGPIPFSLGPLRDTNTFLLSTSTPVHLLVQDFLEKYHDRVSFSQKGESILEFDSSSKSNQTGELHIHFDIFYLLHL